ncbi:MAG: restriction endonuclease [Moorella sp. (in: firmicutes)]
MALHIDWIETFKIWWLVLKFFAPLIVLVIIVEFIKRILDIIMERRSRKAGIYEIDQMSGREFEYRLKSLFQNLGYKVELKRGYKDHGADLILIGSEGARVAVQAKKLSNRNGRVGAKVIGEALRGKAVL